MTLAKKLSDFYTDFHSSAPSSFSAPIKQSTEDFKTSFNPDAAVRAGQAMPSFRLKDALGKRVSSADLIATGPLLIIFYRGAWCPFCNLELREYQARLAEITAKGVNLVAISPELADHSLSTREKNELQFPVLSDEGNVLAHQLGIVFKQPDILRPVFATAEVDLVTRNGDDSLEVPIPATYLVDRGGIIRNAYVEPDYTKRLEPTTALAWIDALNG